MYVHIKVIMVDPGSAGSLVPSSETLIIPSQCLIVTGIMSPLPVVCRYFDQLSAVEPKFPFSENQVRHQRTSAHAQTRPTGKTDANNVGSPFPHSSA